MFFLIVSIYTVFLFSFFIINFYNEYDQAKDILKNENESAQNLINIHIEAFTYYNNQIDDLIAINMNSFLLAEEPFVEETNKELISILFRDNRYFDNLLIINVSEEIEYAYQTISIDILNLNLLNEVNSTNRSILTNQLHPNYYTIIYQYNPDIYFIYYYCQEAMNTLTGNHFFIQDTQENQLIYSQQQIDIPESGKEGFTNFFQGNHFSYYLKVNVFDDSYYYVTQISQKEIFNAVIASSVIPFIVSLLILAFLFFLSYLKIVQIIKKPYERFIFEVESLEEKDFNYLASLNELQTDYVEFSLILKEFKKICLYNKNNYENIIQGIKNELTNAQEGNKSKSLFLANMSHEMRTPLNSIIGYTQLTKKIGFVNQEKVEEYFSCIHNSSEILLQKINDILDLSKIESKQFELHEKPTQIVQVIKDMYDLLSIQAEKKNVDFTFYIDPQIPQYLDIDNTRLKQVLINLCANAIKFTDEGCVKLEVDVFGYTNDSVLLEYIVTDTGIGIPKNKIDNIFYSFCSS